MPEDPRSLLSPEQDWDATVRDRAQEVLVPEAVLRVIEGPAKGKDLLLGGAGRVTVGRDPGNDLVLPDPRVSAMHFEIASSDEGHRLRDMGSTNGTYIGTARVTEALLGPLTRIVAGGSAMTFSPLGTSVPVTLSAAPAFAGLIGGSPVMRRLFAMLERVAPSDLTLLLEGETGTGKEEIARAVHSRSQRNRGPFMVLDCGAIPKGLAEALILGHERGAFTGAEQRREGAFESAHGGTLLLDEIGELPLEMQPKLLRVLESRTVTRLGEHVSRPIDVRVIAATNRDLFRMINEGRFRSDLFYRLAEAQLVLPPLRARKGDVALLADHFLRQAATRAGAPRAQLRPEAVARLERHDWPGNVRELRNLCERLGALQAGQELDEDTVARELRLSAPRSGGMAVDVRLPYKEAKEEILRQFDAQYLAELWDRSQGNLSAASRDAGLARHNLRALLRKAGIRSD